MTVTVVHGQAHRGNTYQVTQMFLEELKCDKNDVKEFTVNGISQCIGCTQCILKDENKCPHQEQVATIIKAMEEADVIVLDSPNYCFGMTGQLKTFCDHLAYRWMSHRPYDMRNKIGVAISTAAGAGASRVTKNIKEQFIWWSMGRVYQIPFIVSAARWDEINPDKIKKLRKRIQKTASKINNSVEQVKPCIKTRFLFRVMKMMHQGATWSEVETEYWKRKGWIK